MYDILALAYVVRQTNISIYHGSFISDDIPWSFYDLVQYIAHLKKTMILIFAHKSLNLTHGHKAVLNSVLLKTLQQSVHKDEIVTLFF